jgi:CBS domain-containing protein
MSREVQYCTPNETLDTAAALMWKHDCGCIPVCSTNGAPHVVGMVTDRDICMSALFQGKPLSELHVADAMSRSVYTCRPTDRPAEAERVMRGQQIRRVPVTSRSGELLGILSLADLAVDAERNGGAASTVGGTLAAICEPARRHPAPLGAQRPRDRADAAMRF